MLHIQHISKVYRTGTLTQQALSDVSLSLRDNEFVAILGPSGSGKTTLLNIIGGLDRYDEGDLVINGISTKRYSDRDWDSYRNHTVGFVFQSYNLIPHQTILKNVELALTISGVSAKERQRRAKGALERVGLREHMHKKPSQLSGGQMQRVAIARALVNDPEILLADEPTGALDSQTSIQVMELLKEVANDRLVVMVTHNPELAELYATRIVQLQDGKITGDSNPAEHRDEGEAVHKNMGKSSMSFLTSLSLSFNNLWTKKARTILVAFAGSIGIIGIALILSMSTGANQYIKNVEEESLQSYPLQISDTTFNLASLYTMSIDDSEQTDSDGKVQEMLTVTNLFSRVTTNDLKSFKTFIESGETDIYDQVQAIEYSYGITPQIYSVKADGSYRKVNPDSSFSALGFSGSSGSNGLLSLVSSTDTFYALPKSDRLYKTGYDLVAGRYPERYNECLVVLTLSGKVTDMTLYTLGLKDPEELDRMVNDFAEGETSDVDATPAWFDLNDIVGVEFSVVPAYSFYTYDSELKVWADHSSDKQFVENLLSDAEKLQVVGVLCPAEDNDSPTLQTGIAYPAQLSEHLGALAADSDAVKAQLASPDTNIFTGKPFGDESQMQMDSIFTVDEKALSDAFNIDLSAFDFSNMDLSGIDFSSMDLSAIDFSSMDPSALDGAFSVISPEDLSKLFDGVNIKISSDKMEALFRDLLEGYLAYAKDDPETDYAKLPDAIRSYLGSSEMRTILLTDLEQMFTENAEKVFTEEQMAALVEDALTAYPGWLVDNGLEDTESYEHLSAYLSSDVGRAQLTIASEKLRDKLMALLLTDEQIAKLAGDLLSGYNTYAHNHSLPSGTALLSSFSEYLGTDDAKKRITDGISGIVDEKELQKLFSNYGELMGSQISAIAGAVMEQMVSQITGVLSSSMAQLGSSLGNNLQNAFKFDPESLGKMFKMNMDAADLEALMGSMLSGEQNSFDSNLRKLGYCDFDKPSMVTIYPNDFDSKTRVKEIISDYNRRMEQNGEDEKVIQYTDMVDTLMGSVSTIINVISWVLIAFVAISLVVSSIMIGVITYISVLERKKEIGILRAIGASRRNISEVFNAETVIIGLLAGLIGVGITFVLLIPGNALLHTLSGQQNINAVLPPLAAVILVGLSIVLTLIGGLIPAAKASHQDPVEALRSE